MPSLTIKDLPAPLWARLRQRAAADRCSLNREVIHLLERVLAEAPAALGPVALAEQIEAQVRMWHARPAGRAVKILDTDVGIELLRGNSRVIERRRRTPDAVATIEFAAAELRRRRPVLRPASPVSAGGGGLSPTGRSWKSRAGFADPGRPATPPPVRPVPVPVPAGTG